MVLIDKGNRKLMADRRAGFYIGISGGHHRSVALLLELPSMRVWCVEGESLNHHTQHPREVTERLAALTSKIAAKLQLPKERLWAQLAQATFAMPGAATELDQEMLEIAVRAAGWPDRAIRIVDDTWAGLIAGTGTYHGVCAVAGTGASVFVGLGDLKSSQQTKIDGWGPIIGDFGSGFQLAVDMLRFFCRAKDRPLGMPKLFQRVLRDFPEIASVNALQSWFDATNIVGPEEWRIRIAQLARSAVCAAEDDPPDEDAKALVRRSAGEMIESISMAFTRAGPSARSLPVVFQGGMFEFSSLYRNTVTQPVRAMTSGPVGLSRNRAVMGALMIALDVVQTWPRQANAPPPSKEIFEEVSVAIEQLPPDERDLVALKLDLGNS